MIKLCLFDFDSTLMDGETIDILAEAYGVGEEVGAITEEAMSGRLDFFEALSKRVSFLRGMNYSAALDILNSLPLITGAGRLCEFLRGQGVRLGVLSGGFHQGVGPAAARLGLDFYFANILHEKNEVLTGLVGGEMMFADSKGLMLARLKKILGLKKQEVLCVGDGFNDLAMFAEAGLSVAFCARPFLRERADICVDEKDLSLLIPELESRFRRI